MRNLLLFIFLFMFTTLSCKKENSLLVSGIVVESKGCLPDSWLVAILDPDFSKHPFLHPTVLDCAACYNCSNSVFISLNPELAVPGTKIRFEYDQTEVSCLSSSEAPEHIRVKEIYKFN